MPSKGSHNKPAKSKEQKKKTQEQASSAESLPEFTFEGKYFALSVLLAGLAALSFWYSKSGSFSSLAPPQRVYGTNYEPKQEELFTVVEIQGKGKGAIANRDIKQGELILREKPLFMVSRNIETAPAPLVYGEVQKLSTEGREAFFNLSYVNFPTNLNPGDHPKEVALAIVQTNAVMAGDAIGIFPRMARLNHGCSSAFNVIYFWRDWESQLVVHALKDIRKGQELLTTYTNTRRTREERRAFLSQHYGFHCTCAVCSLPDNLSKASDNRLSEITRLYAEFSTWGSDKISGPEAIAVIRKIWEIEDEEGYWSERGQLAADATWIAACHSDADAVQAWGQRAADWFSYELGSDSPQTLEMERIVSQPGSHKAWGKKSRLDVGGLGLE